MTFSTLLDLSTINSSMAPIFSLASLYTSTPISFEERHSPSRWTATFVSERSLAGVCAKAAPPNRAVVTRRKVPLRRISRADVRCGGETWSLLVPAGNPEVGFTFGKIYQVTGPSLPFLRRSERLSVYARNIVPALELKVPLPINAASPKDFAATRRGRRP